MKTGTQSLWVLIMENMNDFSDFILLLISCSIVFIFTVLFMGLK